MPGIVTIFEHGPQTLPVGVAITGGQLVQPGSGATAAQVIPATDASLTVLGVAKTDAAPEPAVATASSLTMDIHVPRGDVAVAHEGTFLLTATGAIAFGDKVCAAANGTVRTLVGAGATYLQADANTGDRAMIGTCVEPAGIATTVRGKIRLNIR